MSGPALTFSWLYGPTYPTPEQCCPVCLVPQWRSDEAQGLLAALSSIIRDPRVCYWCLRDDED